MGRAADLREAAAIIKSGAVGTVKEVHVWTNRPVWDQGIDRPSDTPEVPAERALVRVDRPRGNAALSPGISSVQVARLVGLWHRCAGATWPAIRLNMPYMALDLRDPVSCAGDDLWPQHGNISGLVGDYLPVSRAETAGRRSNSCGTTAGSGRQPTSSKRRGSLPRSTKGRQGQGPDESQA